MRCISSTTSLNHRSRMIIVFRPPRGSAEIGHNTVQLGPDWAGDLPVLVEFGRRWAKFGRSGPNLADAGPRQVEVD